MPLVPSQATVAMLSSSQQSRPTKQMYGAYDGMARAALPVSVEGTAGSQGAAKKAQRLTGACYRAGVSVSATAAL